jgi:acid stress-induced BolA-like protein IbaG/YrbA
MHGKLPLRPADQNLSPAIAREDKYANGDSCYFDVVAIGQIYNYIDPVHSTKMILQSIPVRVPIYSLQRRKGDL